MTSIPSSELRDRIAEAIASVTITIGPNSLALLKAGNTLGLSGGEIDAMALSALAEVQAELDRLRAELEQARQQFAAVAAQRDRLRIRMNNLADRWELALAVDKPYARALRAEIKVGPFEPTT